MPVSPNTGMALNPQGDFTSHNYPARDIFSFGVDADLDFNDLDLGFWAQNSKTTVGIIFIKNMSPFKTLIHG